MSLLVRLALVLVLAQQLIMLKHYEAQAQFFTKSSSKSIPRMGRRAIDDAALNQYRRSLIDSLVDEYAPTLIDSVEAQQQAPPLAQLRNDVARDDVVDPYESYQLGRNERSVRDSPLYHDDALLPVSVGRQSGLSYPQYEKPLGLGRAKVRAHYRHNPR